MKKEYLLVVIIVLVALVSFGLGRMSVLEKQKGDREVEFIIPELSKIDMSFKGHSFVASVNGTRYYPRGCRAANRINSENLIYFKTAEDARKSGLERTTASC